MTVQPFTRDELTHLQERLVDAIPDSDLRHDLARLLDCYQQLDWEISQHVPATDWPKFAARIQPT